MYVKVQILSFSLFRLYSLCRSNSGDKSANGGGMNPGGGPGGMKPGQNNQNDPMGASSSDANICRDYMRNGQFGYGIFSIIVGQNKITSWIFGQNQHKWKEVVK